MWIERRVRGLVWNERNLGEGGPERVGANVRVGWCLRRTEENEVAGIWDWGVRG